MSTAMFWGPERPCGSSSSCHRTPVEDPGAPHRPAAAPRSAAVAAPPRARPLSVSGKGVGFHRWTHAHKVAVAVGAVHPAHRGPHLVLPCPRRRERRALARIGALPAVGNHVFQRVRRVGEHVAPARLGPLLDLADLFTYCDLRIVETVILLLRIALGRLA